MITKSNWKVVGGAAVAAYLSMIGSTMMAGASLGEELLYYLGEGPGESLSVSPDGHFILVASPVEIEDDQFISLLPLLNHNPNRTSPLLAPITLDLGRGEITDIAVLPQGPFGLATIRSDDVSPIDSLLVIRGHRVLQEVLLPGSPDGMKLSPDGQWAVVAVEKAGQIQVYRVQTGAGRVSLKAVVTPEALGAFFDEDDPRVVDEDIEPESVAISSDSSFALVTLQEQSSVAAIDLSLLASLAAMGHEPEAVGDLALRAVVNLPFGFVDNEGGLRGIEPDGVAISPDGMFALVAGEADPSVKHLQSLSVLDLRPGLEGITAETYCIFDIDPSLLKNTGLAACPIVAPGDAYPVDAEALPRLDPASIQIVNRGGTTIAAVVIERYQASDIQDSAEDPAVPATINETRGSLMLLDVSSGLDDPFRVVDRVSLAQAGSRLEAIDATADGRWVFVSVSNGGAGDPTFVRLELKEETE